MFSSPGLEAWVAVVVVIVVVVHHISRVQVGRSVMQVKLPLGEFLYCVTNQSTDRQTDRPTD